MLFLFFFVAIALAEYVAPEKIENILIQSLLIGQAFVYGDSLQSSLVAIIIPDEEPVKHALLSASSEDDKALAKASFSDICKSERTNGMIMAEIQRVGKANGLHGFELPRAIHLDHELFSLENGLLTPTFKLKRQQAREK